MHCHLHRGDWSFHPTNEKKKISLYFQELTSKGHVAVGKKMNTTAGLCGMGLAFSGGVSLMCMVEHFVNFFPTPHYRASAMLSLRCQRRTSQLVLGQLARS